MPIFNRESPLGIIYDKDKLVGKTIQGIIAEISHRDRPAYLILNFTDDTFVKIQLLDGGLQEDFGEGPKPILDLKYFGVTQYETKDDPTV